jgi:SAM-dependent methyltransferase
VTGDDRPEGGAGTQAAAYAARLQAKQGVWWKRLLPVQAPYQWNLRRQALGRTIEVGCGIGRNLRTLPPGSVGIDHNAEAVALARATGALAMTPAAFSASELARPATFDGMLLAHVIEHMERDEAEALLRQYLPYLRPGAKVFLLCPQERGFASDPTHVRFTTGRDLVELARSVGLLADEPYSFPFPRWAGRAFVYNEFCLLARLPA